MIVEFYWLYLNRLLLPQQYCDATIKLYWHITLNISTWKCQLCTSGATAQCQELLVTLRSLFTERQIERRVSESPCLRCHPVPCRPPPRLWPPGTGQLREVFCQQLGAREVLGSRGRHFPSPGFKVGAAAELHGDYCSQLRTSDERREEQWS